MPEIVGLGNAVVDLTGKTEDFSDILASYLQHKGGFFRATTEEFANITHDISKFSVCAGGSVCNSLKAIAALGGEAAFIGKIGADELGQIFKTALIEYNVEPALSVSRAEKTACAVVLVDESGEKIICGKMRASKFVTSPDIDFDLIARSKMIFVEGYWLDHMPKLVDEIIAFAVAHQVKIAFTLSDPKIVEEQRGLLARLLPHIDILLGNEHEFAALGECAVALQVKTLGKNGVEILHNGIASSYPALKVETIVNTNGAGDAFAGGFLFEILQGKTIEKAVNTGQKCSQNVLEREMSVVSLNLKEL